MTDYQPGDRVRFEGEGEVRYPLDSDGDVAVRIDGASDTAYFRPEHLTRILPPLVVGEPVPLDRLGELPDGSIVAQSPGRDPAIVRNWGDGSRRWFWAGQGEAKTTYNRSGDPILLRLGDGKS